MDITEAQKIDLIKLSTEELNQFLTVCEANKEACDILAQTLKLLANSGYGVMLQISFRYFDQVLGESITQTGQTYILFLENRINNFAGKILKKDVDIVTRIDTDSVMLNIQPFIDLYQEKDSYKFTQKIFSDVFVPLADKTSEKFHIMSNSRQKRMRMKHEKIFSSTFATNKKRYAFDVVENEGVKYAEPKITVTGIEVVKSSTPTWCREKLKECIRIILREDEKSLQKYVKELKQQYFSGKIILEDIARISSVSDVDKYDDGNGKYKLGAPMHVKAALNLNNQSTNKNLLYNIVNGNKIAYVHLKTPNPTNLDVIAIIDDSLDRLGLAQYLDLKEMWEKTFISPLKLLTDSIGWQIEKKNKLSFL